MSEELKEIKKFYEIIKKYEPLINMKVPINNFTQQEIEAKIIYLSLESDKPLFSKEFLGHMFALVDSKIFKKEFTEFLYCMSIKGKISGKSDDYSQFAQDFSSVIYHIHSLSKNGTLRNKNKGQI